MIEGPDSAANDTWNSQMTLRNPEEPHPIGSEGIERNEAGKEGEAAEEPELMAEEPEVIEEEAEVMMLESKPVEAVHAQRKQATTMRHPGSASINVTEIDTCKSWLRWSDGRTHRHSGRNREWHGSRLCTATTRGSGHIAAGRTPGDTTELATHPTASEALTRRVID